MIEVTVTELREKISDLLGKVEHAREDITIIKHGKPVAVVIPFEAYEFYEGLWGAQMIRELEAERADPSYDPNDTISAADLFAELDARDAVKAAE